MRDDKDYYWDWLKHEDNLFTSRNNFFLVGEAMLLTATAAFYSASKTPKLPILIVLTVAGLFVTLVWLTANMKHVLATEQHIKKKLWRVEPRRSEIDAMRKNWPRNHVLIGILLPGGLVIAWIILMSLMVVI
jgi:hypothetical protein